jgi:hypothetical protein
LKKLRSFSDESSNIQHKRTLTVKGLIMAEEQKEKKMYKYLITLRWYIETDEDLVAGAKETDEKLLEILRHRVDGSRSCNRCPTRHQEGYGILNYHYFMGANKPVYISTEKIQD